MGVFTSVFTISTRILWKVRSLRLYENKESRHANDSEQTHHPAFVSVHG